MESKERKISQCRCGNEDLIIGLRPDPFATGYYVFCLECKSRGPVESTIEDAVEVWVNLECERDVFGEGGQ